MNTPAILQDAHWQSLLYQSVVCPAHQGSPDAPVAAWLLRVIAATLARPATAAGVVQVDDAAQHRVAVRVC